MKSFIKYILSILFPVFGVMALLNFIIDPGHIYSSSYIDDVIEGARRGLNVTNVSNMNERIFKKKLIETYKGRNFDYLIIGSSRVMTISEDCLRGSTALNLGVSGSKLEDMIALYQICIDNNVHFKTVIIGTDPTLFNGNDKDNRWEAIGSFYNEYNGEKQINLEANFKFTLFQNLFSPSYFKTTLKDLPNALKGNAKIEYVKTFINDGGTKRPDGSIYYAKEYRESPQSLVDNDAMTCNHGSFNDFTSLSEERKSIFTNFIDNLQSKGINIIIWRCPYHPLFYKRIMAMKGILPSISFIGNYAKKNNFKVIGDFNPQKLGLTNKDFYDGFHMKKETVDKIMLDGLQSN